MLSEELRAEALRSLEAMDMARNKSGNIKEDISGIMKNKVVRTRCIVEALASRANQTSHLNDSEVWRMEVRNLRPAEDRTAEKRVT